MMHGVMMIPVATDTHPSAHKMLHLARRLSDLGTRKNLTGVKFGQQCSIITPPLGRPAIHLILWHRLHRAQYMQFFTYLDSPLRLKKMLGSDWMSYSFIMMYFYTQDLQHNDDGSLQNAATDSIDTDSGAPPTPPAAAAASSPPQQATRCLRQASPTRVSEHHLWNTDGFRPQLAWSPLQSMCAWPLRTLTRT
eukprot:5621939-Amphidinium_carterae.1